MNVKYVFAIVAKGLCKANLLNLLIQVKHRCIKLDSAATMIPRNNMQR